MRSSFAYTVMDLNENKCLGCLYIFPTNKEKIDTEVYMWVRTSEFKKGLDKILFETVQKWIKQKWPFNNVIYPGR